MDDERAADLTKVMGNATPADTSGLWTGCFDGSASGFLAQRQRSK
jgi:hypothetical protein